jgi:hypothetical protein
MPYERIPIERLIVNPANDRHGELQNETAAIAELFRLREQHMRNLARDIKDEGTVYDPPLVYPDGENFLVFDGNRRVTCLKLTLHPERAPSQDLQAFFHALQQEWDQPIPPSWNARSKMTERLSIVSSIDAIRALKVVWDSPIGTTALNITSSKELAEEPN